MVQDISAHASAPHFDSETIATAQRKPATNFRTARQRTEVSTRRNSTTPFDLGLHWDLTVLDRLQSPITRYHE